MSEPEGILDSEIIHKLDKLKVIADTHERENDEIDEIWEKRQHNRKLHNHHHHDSNSQMAELQRKQGMKLLEKMLQLNDQNEEDADQEDNVEVQVEEETDDDSDDSVYTYSTDLSRSQKIDEEWDNVLSQLDLIVAIVLIPLLGKFLGRKFAHKIWGVCASWLYKQNS